MNERDIIVVNSTIDYLVEKGRDRVFLEGYATKLVGDDDVEGIGDYVSLSLLEIFE